MSGSPSGIGRWLRRWFFRPLYRLRLRKPYRSIDRVRYLKRLTRGGKSPNDWWYYSDKDAEQFKEGETLARLTFNGAEVFFYCRLSQHVERRLLKSGLISDPTATLLARLAPAGGLMVDAGAHIGTYAVALAKSQPDLQVHAFEPSPFALERLRANARLNRLANLTIHPAALGDFDGEAEFYAIPGPQSALSSFSGQPRDQAQGEKIIVPVQTLDRVLGQNPRPVGLIKIDVQGQEIAVLQGAREVVARDRPYVVLEHEDLNFADPALARQAKERLKDFFQGLHYAVFYLTRYGDDLLFPVEWGQRLNGDLLAIPLGKE